MKVIKPKDSYSSGPVISHFRHQIMSGALQAGERLPSEAKLCEQFSASRTVIREAMQQLKAQGYIKTIVGSGSYVCNGSLDHLRDSLSFYSCTSKTSKDWLELLQLRQMIESESVRQLAKEKHIPALSPIWQALETMRANINDLDAFAAADVDFHFALVSATENKIFASILEALRPIADKFAKYTYEAEQGTQARERILAEHEAIFESIRNADVAAAVANVELHLNNSITTLDLESIEKN
ncbi:FadR/GntR family transcriptional regulator [Persicirhabdus sediminis]|uniref:FadR family transcriptional regulator n=1 Tax=Persicirhabdus sediminis TaxID=454144 RepID=A0A8J7MBN2_9BACT|nr:FCD domain-containing protein [Persicirhabdus sediminis]MBK1790614.1 FadR family transcriptional regulator [Persicirhabdus sediminis]